MSVGVDARGRRAAAAARASVATVAAAAVDRSPVAGRARGRRRVVAAAVAAAATVVVALALAEGDGTTRLETEPAAPSAPTSGAPPPPPPSRPAPAAPGAVLATGTAADGSAWTLSIGGPTGTLCLAVELDERITPQTCAGRPPGAPVPEADRYRPLLTGDVRVPRFVFGRVPSGTAEVVVELAPPATWRGGEVMTVEREAEPLYVVELAPGERPTAVVALRADGGTSRYAVGG